MRASSSFLGSFDYSSAYLPACLMPDYYCLITALPLSACLPSSFIVHALLACACHASSSASASEWAILTHRGTCATLCQNIRDALGEGRRGRSVLPAACACHRLTNSLGLRHSSVLTRVAVSLNVPFILAAADSNLLTYSLPRLLRKVLARKGAGSRQYVSLSGVKP